jgi:hypothetical protein
MRAALMLGLLTVMQGAIGASAQEAPSEFALGPELQGQSLQGRPLQAVDRQMPDQFGQITPIGVMPEISPPATLLTSSESEALSAAAQPPRQEDGDTYTLEQLQGEMKKLLWTKGDYKIVPYGILWGSTAYETERTFTGDYTFYVLPDRPNTENAFHADARSTRFGIDVSGPSIPFFNCATSGGKLEFDFQRLIDTENKAGVLLRHAYLEVKDEEFRLLFGQTWDVISPLNPAMLMYSIGWGAGNIGYRRAQIRGERYFALSDTTLLTLQGSANVDITNDTATGMVGDHSGWPVLEGRAATTFGPRGPGCTPMEFGVSSHIGEQIFNFAAPFPNPVTGLARATWSLNADYRIPITQRFGVQGEFFMGQNLAAYLGGILQGIDVGTPANPGTRDGIFSRGGWFDVWYDWTPRLHSHAGYSIDDPLDRDVTVGRTYNAFYWTNLCYDVTPKFLVGIEASSWRTLWVNQPDGVSQRIEFAAKYGF